MNRPEMMKGLRALGVDAPEIPCEQVGDEAVEGVLRWARDQNRKGRPADSGMIARKLMNGGLEGYGTVAEPAKQWWRTSGGREAWLERNVAGNPIHAENAVVSLLQEKREPSLDLVRQYAELSERQQAEHDEKCRHAVRVQVGLAHEKKEEESLGVGLAVPEGDTH